MPFKIEISDGIVSDIAFRSALIAGTAAEWTAGVDHLDRAAWLVETGVEVGSIIVVVEPLESDLWDDPEYARWTASVGASEARVAARMLMRDSTRVGPDEIRARMAELEFPTLGGNDTPNDKYFTEVFDAVAEEFEILSMIDVVDNERLACECELRDDAQEHGRELSDDEVVEQWLVRRRELLAPRPVIRRRRLYSLPCPLDEWDPRNVVQQWYFVATEGQVNYWHGGSGSSGQRDTHGRMGHTFAALSSVHGVPVRTVVLRYDSRNALAVIRDSPSLLLDAMDLVGNYPVGYEVSRQLARTYVIDARRYVGN